jgi:hypothetical protein
MGCGVEDPPNAKTIKKHSEFANSICHFYRYRHRWKQAVTLHQAQTHPNSEMETFYAKKLSLHCISRLVKKYNIDL